MRLRDRDDCHALGAGGVASAAFLAVEGHLGGGWHLAAGPFARLLRGGAHCRRRHLAAGIDGADLGNGSLATRGRLVELYVDASQFGGADLGLRRAYRIHGHARRRLAERADGLRRLGRRSGRLAIELHDARLPRQGAGLLAFAYLHLGVGQFAGADGHTARRIDGQAGSTQPIHFPGARLVAQLHASRRTGQARRLFPFAGLQLRASDLQFAQLADTDVVGADAANSLALRLVEGSAGEGPILLGDGVAYLAFAAALVAEAEQAVLPGGQGEAGQGQGIDLLLGQVWRQLGIERDMGRDRSAGSTVFDSVTTAQIGVLRADHAVVQALVGLQDDVAASLDDGRVAFAVQRCLIYLPPGQVFPFHHADEAIEVGLQRCQLRRRRVLAVEAGGGIRVVVIAWLAAGDEDADRLDVAGLDALVFQDGDAGLDVSARADQAAVVEQLLATDRQVPASHQAGGGAAFDHFQLVALGHLPDAHASAIATQVAIAAGVVGTAASQFLDDRGVLAGVVDYQDVPGVVDYPDAKAKIAFCLQRAGQVVQTLGPVALFVPGQVDITQAVHIRIAVGEGIHIQRHIVAAEDQSVLVEQVGGVQDQAFRASQRAVVGQGRGGHAQVAGGGETAMVEQLPTDGEGAHTTRGDAGHFRQVQAGGNQAEVAQAGKAAIAAVAAGEGQVQTAVAGDQAVVGPGAAPADKGLGGQQLPAGGLGESADVQGQASGLEHAVVAPAAGAEGEAAVGGDAAAGAADLGQGDGELARAGVQQLAVLVGQAAEVQRQVMVGGLQGAVAVVQQAAELEDAGTRGAEGAQLAALVVQAGARDGEAATAFDNALAVVQHGTGVVRQGDVGRAQRAAAVVQAAAAQ